MAVVKLSALLSSIKGSIGHATFQQFGNQIILRQKPIISNNPSVNQQSVRAIMAYLDSYWRATTPAIRQLYNNAVKDTSWVSDYRAQKIYSGISLFKAYNMLRLLNNLAVLTSFSQPKRVTPFSIYSFGYSSGYVVIYLDDYWPSDLYWPIIYIDDYIKPETHTTQHINRLVGLNQIEDTGFRSINTYLNLIGDNYHAARSVKLSGLRLCLTYPIYLTIQPVVLPILLF
jgi:hypothetical protein